jgi:hypothetical protein
MGSGCLFDLAFAAEQVASYPCPTVEPGSTPTICRRLPPLCRRPGGPRSAALQDISRRDLIEVLDPTTTAIITGAAGNIVAYMLNGRVDALRAWVGRIFRHGAEAERSQALSAIDQDLSDLRSMTRSEAELTAQWKALLATYVTEHPDATSDIRAMPAMSAPGKSVNIGHQNNFGSGTFIGGDNYGGIHSPSPENSDDRIRP